MGHALLCLLTAAIVLVPVGIQGRERPENEPVVTDEDLLLCLVQLAGTTLSRDLMTYMVHGGNMLLPLEGIGRLLELGIRSDPSAQQAGGHVARPGQDFMLDIGNGIVSVSGKARTFDPSRIAVLQDDIYVESKLLGEWLSMHIDANRLESSINIKPFEPLPLQQRLARQRRGSNTWGYRSNDPDYPVREAPYRFLGGPAIDMTGTISLLGNKKSIETSENRFSSRISGDLLWMNAQLDLSGVIDGESRPFVSIDNGRLLLEQVSPDGDLLGPLGATKVAIGDIHPASLPGAGNISGPGLMVSSYPVQRSQDFDTVTLRGFLGDGWDVELFRNGMLLDYRPSNPDQSYIFSDIPLMYGYNELKLIFNGPQGYHRTETRHFHVGQNMIEPGNWAYQASLTDASGSSLLSSDASDSPRPTLSWKSDVGVTRWLTASNLLATVFEDEDQLVYAGAGLSGYLQMMQIEMQTVRELESGRWAYQAGLLTRLEPVSLSLTLQDYQPGWKTTGQTAAILQQITGRIDGLRPLPFSPSSSMSVRYGRTSFVDGQERQIYGIISTNRTLGVLHTHRINFERHRQSGSRRERFYGSSYASLIRKGKTLRLQTDYQITPIAHVERITAGGEYRFDPVTVMSGAVTYNPLHATTDASLGFSHTGKSMSYGIQGGYSSTHTWRVGLQLSLSLLREPRQGTWHASGHMLSQQGNISALVYLDENRNRIHDENERPLDNVGFFVNLQNHPDTTDTKGIAILKDLPPNVYSDVSISTATLEDLLWIPVDKSVRVTPRPGYAVTLDFPVWTTGVISGMVDRIDNERRTPAPGIQVEAVNSDGTVIERTVSGYDGFYELTNLPPGKCSIRVSPDQSAKLSFASSLRQVLIDREGSYIDNIDLLLEPLPPEHSSRKNDASLQAIPAP